MLAEAGKLWSIREWAAGFHYLFIKPGVLRRIFIPWLRFLRKDFHPWQHDNRYLIDAWEEREDGAGSPATSVH
jgi:predicted metal-dependent hydrolase